MSDIRNAADLATYDGYILGSPTFSLDIPKPVKTFLPLFKNLSFAGKLCGAFGPIYMTLLISIMTMRLPCFSISC